jgi:hypothetical protein
MKNTKKYDQHVMHRTVVREHQKQAGFFDGRFVSRSESSKKTYNRKQKHKSRLDS